MFFELLIWFCDVTTIGLCVICKVPQIWAILKSGNVDGLSDSSLFTELLTYAISLCYNVMKGYPMMSYMEDPFLVLQTLLVLLLVYYYNGNLTVNRLGTLGGLAALFYSLTLGFPHPAVLPMLLTSTVPMKIFSKLMQVKEIYVRKSAGSVSLVSWIINVYTCATRIVTTYLVTADTTLLTKHMISISLNGLVIATAMYYQKKAKDSVKEVKKSQ